MPRKGLIYVQRQTTRHGETVFYFRRGQTQRIRLPDDFGSPEFMAAYKSALAGEPTAPWQVNVYARRDARLSSIFSRILRGCRNRAKAKDRGFDLTVEWLMELGRRQQYRCAVSGVLLDLKSKSSRECRSPYAPSIDRIDCKRGYTRDNVRIVALAVNIMLYNWGEEVLARVAESYTGKQRRSIPSPSPKLAPHPSNNPTVSGA